MIADVTPHAVRPSLMSIAGALVVGVSIAIQMIRAEPERRDAAGQPEIFPSVWQKIVSGPAVLIVLFLAVAIYAAGDTCRSGHSARRLTITEADKGALMLFASLTIVRQPLQLSSRR